MRLRQFAAALERITLERGFPGRTSSSVARKTGISDCSFIALFDDLEAFKVRTMPEKVLPDPKPFPESWDTLVRSRVPTLTASEP
jgi:hypothetical protein